MLNLDGLSINESRISGLTIQFPMAIKKYLIHCMLALCIGLLPVLNAGAMNVEYSDTMLMDCIDCDPAEMNHDSSCKNQDCNSVTQSCGSHTSANYLPPSPLVDNIPEVQINGPGQYNPDYQPGVNDTIYRPPIA